MPNFLAIYVNFGLDRLELHILHAELLCLYKIVKDFIAFDIVHTLNYVNEVNTTGGHRFKPFFDCTYVDVTALQCEISNSIKPSIYEELNRINFALLQQSISAYNTH